MIEFVRKVGKRCKPVDEIPPGTLLIVQYKGHSLDGCIFRASRPTWYYAGGESLCAVKLFRRDGTPTCYNDDPSYGEDTERYTDVIKKRLCCYYEMGVVQL